MAEQKLIELIERYLNGELSEDELIRFELLRMENADVNNRIEEHQQFTALIKQYGERLELEKRLNEIHDEIDVHALTEELMVHPSWIVNLWRHHHSKISVAASIFIFAVLCTLIFTGYLNNRETNYLKLARDFNVLRSKVDKLQPHNAARISKPSNFGGTGFAISSNGYIVTNYHVIYKADSVYVENANGKSFKAKVFYTEPNSDIAILQVTDTAFINLGTLPYTIKKSDSDIGENVYTLGYPRDAMVFGTGFLTANTGFTDDKSSDSTTYQVSLPVNPGNSGGPLIDSRGNLIGIINAKETKVEGAHFAIKSSYLLKAIQDIPSDSLKKPLNVYSKNILAGLSKVQQVKKLQNFVFMVKVYN
jgi:S1-C subfamily serine protease